MKSRGLTQGCKAIITGASTGIGRALSVQLAKKYKAQLVITARTESHLNETKELVEKAGGKAIAVVGDIAEHAVQKAAVDASFNEFGCVDILVNNAGLAKPGSLMRLTPEDWERVFAVNFFAPLRLTYAVLPHFVDNKKGKIVNISSVAGKVSFPGSVCYAASKFALTGMSEGMAAELARHGVDVITVCPGWVRSEFFTKNQLSESRNPTIIAQQKNLSGLIMRNLLSISSDECAADTIRAMEKGGSHEIVLTHPGRAVERLQALCPSAISMLSKTLSKQMVESSAATAPETNTLR